MAKFIWRRKSVAWATESSRGAGAVPSRWIKNLEIGVRDVMDRQVIEEGAGNVAAQQTAFNLSSSVEGAIPEYLKSETIGEILYGLLGAISSGLKAGESVVYEHTFTESNSNQKKTLCVSTDDPIHQLLSKNVVVKALRL